MEVRWRARLGPPLAVLVPLATIAALAVPAVAAANALAANAWNPPDCGAGGASRAAPGSAADPAALAGGAWFRIDPVVADDGSLAGQRLTLGRLGRSGARTVALPEESSAAGPFGHVVAIVADDSGRSELSLVDVDAGCRRGLGVEHDVVRRVTIDPAGTFLYETRVDRRTRTDRGVWRRPVDGGPARRVMAPLALDPRFGRTFSTELVWSAEGSLVVESCGALRCRFRVLDPTTNQVSLVDDPGLGPLVGMAGGRLVASGPCRGLPCPLFTVDPAAGRVAALVPAAGLATLVAGPDGTRLVTERVGPDAGLDVVDVVHARVVRTFDVPPGLRPVNPARALGGAPVPAGWVLLAPDGRGPAGTSVEPLLVRVSDGRIAGLTEVIR